MRYVLITYFGSGVKITNLSSNDMKSASEEAFIVTWLMKHGTWTGDKKTPVPASVAEFVSILRESGQLEDMAEEAADYAVSHYRSEDIDTGIEEAKGTGTAVEGSQHTILEVSHERCFDYSLRYVGAPLAEAIKDRAIAILKERRRAQFEKLRKEFDPQVSPRQEPDSKDQPVCA